MPTAPTSAARVTLRSPATVAGVGLFTGAPTRATIRPAHGTATGLRFCRTDLGAPEAARPFPASHDRVVPEARRTVLAADPGEVRAVINTSGPAAASGLATVQTIEHVLSALAGLGVTDALIEVHGPELPAGDGSAGPFVEAMLAAGLCTAERSAAPAPAVVREPIRIADNGSLLEALPLSAGELEAAASGAGPAAFYRYHLDYSNFPIPALAPVACRRVPAQAASIALPLDSTAASRSEYATQVAPARTFCLAEEAQAMRQCGLFAHLTPRDMLVIGDTGPIDNAYRFDNEPARHKLLDLIGDLALCGRPIVGRIVATRTGHSHNHELARRLAALP